MSEIPGLKLIRHNAAGVRREEDPSYPFKLSMKFQAPDFLNVAFAFACGPTEDIEVRGMTLEAIQEFITRNDFRTHPRLRVLTITGPDGEVEKFDRTRPARGSNLSPDP